MPQKPKLHGSKRPFGPLGEWKVQSCSATFGASRTATAQAPGGFMIRGPLPRNQPFVIGGIVPGEHARRQRRGDLSEPRQDLPDNIRFDRDVALLVDELGALGG